MGTGQAFDRKRDFFYSNKPEIRPYSFGKVEIEEDLRHSVLEELRGKSTRLSKDEMQMIEGEFNHLSRNQLIGRNKLLQYFNLEDISETPMATAFLNTLKHTGGDRRFIDWPTFLNFVIILGKGSKEERLELFFQLFNIDNSDKYIISKRNLKQAIWHIFCSLLQVTYEDKIIEDLKSSLINIQENQFLTSVDLIVEEIFDSHGPKGGISSESLSFEQWSQWVCSIVGMEESLEAVLKPIVKSTHPSLSIVDKGNTYNIHNQSPPKAISSVSNLGKERKLSGTDISKRGREAKNSVIGYEGISFIYGKTISEDIGNKDKYTLMKNSNLDRYKGEEVTGNIQEIRENTPDTQLDEDIQNELFIRLHKIEGDYTP